MTKNIGSAIQAYQELIKSIKSDYINHGTKTIIMPFELVYSVACECTDKTTIEEFRDENKELDFMDNVAIRVLLRQAEFLRQMQHC